MNNLDQSLFNLLILETLKTNHVFLAEGDKLGQEFNLSSARWRVMGAISNHNHGLTISKIAQLLQQSRQGILRLVNEMTRCNLLITKKNPKHKSSLLYTLSEHGLLVFNQLQIKQKKWAEQINTEITTTDLQTTIETLKKLSNSFT